VITHRGALRLQTALCDPDAGGARQPCRPCHPLQPIHGHSDQKQTRPISRYDRAAHQQAPLLARDRPVPSTAQAFEEAVIFSDAGPDASTPRDPRAIVIAKGRKSGSKQLPWPGLSRERKKKKKKHGVRRSRPATSPHAERRGELEEAAGALDEGDDLENADVRGGAVSSETALGYGYKGRWQGTKQGGAGNCLQAPKLGTRCFSWQVPTIRTDEKRRGRSANRTR